MLTAPAQQPHPRSSPSGPWGVPADAVAIGALFSTGAGRSNRRKALTVTAHGATAAYFPAAFFASAFLSSSGLRKSSAVLSKPAAL